MPILFYFLNDPINFVFDAHSSNTKTGRALEVGGNKSFACLFDIERKGTVLHYDPRALESKIIIYFNLEIAIAKMS